MQPAEFHCFNGNSMCTRLSQTRLIATGCVEHPSRGKTMKRRVKPICGGSHSGLEEGLDSLVEGGGLVVHDEVAGVVDAVDL